MANELSTRVQDIVKAGAGANAVIVADTGSLDNWNASAQSTIAAIARADVVAGFSGYKAVGKEILQSLSSALVAQQIVSYSLDANTIPAEQQLLMNFLETEILRYTKMLEDDKVKTYLGIT